MRAVCVERVNAGPLPVRLLDSFAQIAALAGIGSVLTGTEIYELFSSTEILGKLAMEKMLAGLSTRRYAVGRRIAETSSATSKSAVFRRFVALNETALTELLTADLSGLDLVALMIDGVHFAESCCIVALGIGVDGVKHPLALVEGWTENATLVTDLLVNLRGEAWMSPARGGGPGRVQGAAQGGARRARSPGDPTLPTA